MENYETQYLELLKDLIKFGERIPSRNGDTLQLTNKTISADCSDGKIPLITTKKVNYRAAITELIWFLRGEQNVKFLNDHDVHIWDQWADAYGDLGPIYGVQWKKQFNSIIELAKKEPYSRRLLVNSWDVMDLPYMRLPPCHYSFQIVNYPSNKTDLVVSMRSNDTFVGLPFNLINYSILLNYICSLLGTKAGHLHINVAASHLYREHFDAALEQVQRKPKKCNPTLITSNARWVDKKIFNLTPEMFVIQGYEHHPAIKVPVFK